MAEATFVTTTRVPVGEVWDFVQEMDNWARFVTGYQGHEKQSETESTWTLKGDVGVLSRTLTFRVRIVEWSGPERVRFELEGVNEPMRGEGAFAIEAASAEGAVSAPAGARPVPVAAEPRRGRLFRLLEAFWRRLLRALGGRVEREAPPAAGAAAARMSFHLRLEPGGPMAPMINAMITPMMRPAAEDLASRILAHLEARPRA